MNNSNLQAIKTTKFILLIFLLTESVLLRHYAYDNTILPILVFKNIRIGFCPFFKGSEQNQCCPRQP
jgi:hypothetical protein